MTIKPQSEGSVYEVVALNLSDGNREKEQLLFKYSRIIYVNLLCQYFCQDLRTRGCVETEAGLCLSENAKQVFKTVGLSKCTTDNGDYKHNNNNTTNNDTNNTVTANNKVCSNNPCLKRTSEGIE